MIEDIGKSRQVGRRTVAKGAAWSLPVLAVGAAAPASAASGGCSGGAGTQTWDAPGVYTFTVPDCGPVTFSVLGGGGGFGGRLTNIGGTGPVRRGSAGALAVGTITAAPGTVLTIYVGQGGQGDGLKASGFGQGGAGYYSPVPAPFSSDGKDCSGGGGGSAILVATEPLVVAGGGGGGGWAISNGPASDNWAGIGGDGGAVAGDGTIGKRNGTVINPGLGAVGATGGAGGSGVGTWQIKVGQAGSNYVVGSGGNGGDSIRESLTGANSTGYSGAGGGGYAGGGSGALGTVQPGVGAGAGGGAGSSFLASAAGGAVVAGSVSTGSNRTNGDIRHGLDGAVTVSWG